MVIVNCENSAAIHSASSGNVYAGSYVGCVVDKDYIGTTNDLIIDACSFLGSIDLSAGKSGGGFIGKVVQLSGSVYMKYCLFTPSALNIKEIDDSDGKFYMFGPNLNARWSCYNSLALEYRSPTGNKPLDTSQQGQLIRTVSGGDYITVAMDGTPTEHNVSGITTYKDGENDLPGFVYGNEICGGVDFYLYLLLSYGGDTDTFYAYVANHGTLSGTEKTCTNDHYTLTMSNHNTVISASGIVVLRDDVDNSAVITAMAGQSKNVTVGRTFVHGAWNSICLPFNVSAATVSNVFGDATQLRRLSSSDFTDGELSLSFVDIEVSLAGTIIIEAGKPYLIKPSNDVVNPVFGSVTIVNSSTPIVTNVATFTPVINPTAFTARDMTILFITGDGQLSFPLNNESIKGFRTYILLTGAAAGQ